LQFSFGSSGLLTRQIESGAPFDVFLSASETFLEELVRKGRVNREDILIYALGRLGLWSKSGTVRSFEDFFRFERFRLTIANPQHAPYGLAAKQALEKAGIWARLEPNVILAENVRQAMQFAETGNADAVLAAWSLVHNREGILVPGEWHAPIKHSGAELRKSKQRKLGRKLMEYLTSPPGRALLTGHGLFVPAYAPSLKGVRPPQSGN
jgi:molybdate transport system substrate-binding protein